MSFLCEIKNFIKTEILGIENNTPLKPDEKKKENTPVIQCEDTGKNEDTFEHKATSSKPETKQNIGQIKQSIEVMCRANGLNYTEIMKTVDKLSGSNANADDIMKILETLRFTITKTIELQKKYGSSGETDINKIIQESTKTIFSAIQSGLFQDIQEFENETGDINAELGKDFQQADINERRKRMESVTLKRKKKFDTNLQAQLEKLPEEQRTIAKQRLTKRYNLTAMARFNEVVATSNSETALHAMSVLPAEEMNYGAELVLETRVNQAERTRTADLADFKFFEGMLETYYKRGEEPSSSVVKSYNSTMTASKSKQAVYSYQEDYNTRRQSFEKGEDIPPYLNEEVFTATAQGIGEGAVNNINLTSEEKAEFLIQWENDAKQYSDYSIVTSQVKEELQTNNKYKKIAEKVEEVKSQQKQDAELVFVQEDNSNIQSSTEISPITYTTGKKDNKINNVKNENIKTAAEVSNPKQKRTSNPILIAKNIKEYSINEAIKEYGEADVITTILDNQSLKHLRPLLATVIKSYDKNSLKEITQNCSDSAFVYICSIVNKDYISELKETRESLCYAARNMIENMEKEYEAA